MFNDLNINVTTCITLISVYLNNTDDAILILIFTFLVTKMERSRDAIRKCICHQILH